jgi:DNA primase
MNIFLYLKQRISLLDVVGQHTNLKRAGSYFKGQCPFHQEKTASFTVSPDKGIFHCFGCQINGDVIAFAEKIEQCSTLQAARLLAERYNIDISQFNNSSFTKEDSNKKERYFATCALFVKWSYEQLLNNNSALFYLHKRGFTDEIIKQFSLGYFPGGLASVQRLVRYCAKQKILVEDLLNANILRRGNNVLYSAFEERLLFPITDIIGRYCAFGGRVLLSKDKRPKYYNSRESNYFHKGSLLFGFNQAKKVIQQTEKVFLVEGYTDCLAMVQHGYANTVATLGTACTKDHLSLLARHTTRLYVLYDADSAGHKAIMRLVDLCWKVDLELYVVSLPEGDDPATYLLKNTSLDDLIKQSTDIFNFVIQSVSDDVADQSMRTKLSAIRTLLQQLARIDDPLKRELIADDAARSLDVSRSAILQELARYVADDKEKLLLPDKQLAVEQKESKTSQFEINNIDKSLFSAIIHNVSYIKSNRVVALIDFLPQFLKDILLILQSVDDQGYELLFDAFYAQLACEQQAYVNKTLLEVTDIIDEKMLDCLLVRFQKKRWKIIVNTLKKQIEHAKSSGEHEVVVALLERFAELKRTSIMYKGVS